MMKSPSSQPCTHPNSSDNTARQSKRQKFLGKLCMIKLAVKRVAHKTKSFRPIRLRKKSTYVPFHIWEAEYVAKQRKVAESQRQDTSNAVMGERFNGAVEEGFSPNETRYPELQIVRDENNSAGSHDQQPLDASIVNDVTTVRQLCPKRDNQRHDESQPSVSKKKNKIVESDTREATEHFMEQNSHHLSLSNRTIRTALEAPPEQMELQELHSSARGITQKSDNGRSSPTCKSTNFDNEVLILAAGGLTIGKKLVHDEAQVEEISAVPLRESTLVPEASSLFTHKITSSEVSSMDSGTHDDSFTVCGSMSGDGTNTNCQSVGGRSVNVVQEFLTSEDGIVANVEEISNSSRNKRDKANEYRKGGQGGRIERYNLKTPHLTDLNIFEDYYHSNCRTAGTGLIAFGSNFNSSVRMVGAGIFSRKPVVIGNGSMRRPGGLETISDSAWSSKKDEEALARSRRKRRGCIFGLLVTAFFLRK